MSKLQIKQNDGEPTPLRGSTPDAGSLLCPHCGRPFSQHHGPCSRRFTRRFLFGLFAGAAAAMAIPDVWGKAEVLPYGDTDNVRGALLFRANHEPFTYIPGLFSSEESAISLTVTSRIITNHNRVESVEKQMLIVRNPVVPFWRRQGRADPS